MAKTNSQGKAKSINFKLSHGIDLIDSHVDEAVLSDVCNLFVREDGSLEMRHGYSEIYHDEFPIRALWSGVIDGVDRCFFLAADRVYHLDGESFDVFFIDSIGTSQGEADFFFFDEKLYLGDSQGFYLIDTDAVIAQIGYVPLFGKDWGTSFPGPIYQPLNIMNTYARISYKIPPNPTALLPTLHPVSSIISLFKNGVLVPPEDYSYNPLYNAIVLQDLCENDELLATVRFDLEVDPTPLLSSCHGACFGEMANSRLYLWGGTKKNMLFFARKVSAEDLRLSSELILNSGALYFRQDACVVVGDGRYPICAVQRHYDRLLIFTEDSTWMSAVPFAENEGIPLLTINTENGCTGVGGCVSIDNDPFTVGRSDILRWTADTDRFDLCNSYSISRPLCTRLDEKFFKNARLFYNRRSRELWVHNKNCAGDVWVYSLKHRAWTRLSGITADAFFSLSGRVAFFLDERIYVFFEELYYDNDDVYNPITAELCAEHLEFGTPLAKRLSHIELCGEAGSGVVGVDLQLNSDEHCFASFTADEHSTLLRRFSGNRFKSIRRLELHSSGQPFTLHSLSLFVR